MPHSLRGYATLAVRRWYGWLSLRLSALALMRSRVEHYIAPTAITDARTARVASMLLGTDLTAAS